MKIHVAELAFNLAPGVLGASGHGMGVWTAGCSLVKCPGCASRHTWDVDPLKAVDTSRLVALAQALPERPRRLTISGGEPTDQADATADLAERFRASFPDAEIVLYTGLRWRRFRAAFVALAQRVDVVVAGPYVAGRPATPLSGSDNQTVHLLTGLAQARYANWQGWRTHRLQSTSLDGRIVTVGIPDTRALSRATQGMAVRDASWLADEDVPVSLRGGRTP